MLFQCLDLMDFIRQAGYTKGARLKIERLKMDISGLQIISDKDGYKYQK